MSIQTPLLLSHMLPFRYSKDLSTTPTIGLMDTDSSDLSKAIFKEESASRKTLLQAKLKNNKRAVDMARIFLNRALKSLHQKSSMWDKDVREQMEKAEQEMEIL